MKRKFSKILGVGLAITVLASLLVTATPASGGTLSWSEETTTKNLKSTTLSTALAPTGTNLVDLAVIGTTIYAAAQAATNNVTYKSTDGGVTWSSLKFTTSYPTTKVIKKVAVAPDDANTVVLLTTDSTVYYSSNGGSSWTNLGVPASGATISDIDVSGGTTKNIAAAGAVSGAAELYTLSVALAQSWTARYDTTGTAPAGGAKTDQTNIFAVKFSPNYTSDNNVVVVSGNSTEIPLVQTFRNTSGARGWNGNITGFTNWGTGIQILSAPSGGIGAVDIALHPAYRGASETERIAFVAIGGATSGGGVVRLTDVTATEMKTWAGVSLGAVGSIAYHSASGKFLAGDYDNNQVYYFTDAMVSAPKAAALTSLKQPGGENKTVVAWVGDNAVAATSGNESAFALSTDAKSFNDISLIDTAISTMSDVALSADASTIYLTTNDGADTSVWVKTTAGWQRIFSERGDYSKHLVRIAPDNAAVAYVADQGTTDMWVTKNSGTTWSYIPIYNLTSIQDFVVQSADVVYAIDGTGLSKTSDAGGSWGSKKSPTDTFAAYMVTLAANSAGSYDVLIGGSDGYVAYSKDGGATLTRTQITVAGNVQVIADKDYATNNYIYAGVATAVYRGKADSTSSFTGRSPTFATDYTSPVIKGLVRDGTIIYALSSNGTDSALSRALNLTSTVASAADALWSTATSTYELEATPQALRLTSGGVLWAIDTSNTLVSFTDGLSVGAPVLKTPATAYEIPINTTTGLAYDTTFTWARQNTSVTGTVLEIATDAAFTSIIYTNTNSAVTTDIVSRVIGPSGSTDDSGARANFMPGTTYYWRVRASAPLRSAWSETRTLTVGQVTPATTTITVTAPPVTVTTPPVTVTAAAPAAAVIPFGIVSPAIGATDVSINPILTWTAFEKAIGYEIALATDSTFAIIDYSHNVPKANLFYASETLNYNTTYYWRVRGITGPAPAKKAAPGGAWATGAFTTMAEPVKAVAPVAPAPQVIVQKEPPEIKVIEVPVQTPQPIPSYLLWIIIVIGAVLIIALIVLIARTRRVA